jgi:hypothetical protein
MGPAFIGFMIVSVVGAAARDDHGLLRPQEPLRNQRSEVGEFVAAIIVGRP